MQQPLTPQQIRVYEARLRTMLAALSHTVEGVERDALEPSGGTRFQEVDESIEEAALTTDLELLETEDELGYAVGDALERIAAGTFGLCTACGGPISRERLDVLPHARECKTCARASESGSR